MMDDLHLSSDEETIPILKSKNVVYALVIKNSITTKNESKIAGVFYSMEGAWNEIERKVTAAMETIIDTGYTIHSCYFKENSFVLKYRFVPGNVLNYVEYSIVKTTIQ